jgi:ubiquinone/menaquinone biosynthesis C-methylase UbiE
MVDQKKWFSFSFEDRAERFYGLGVENYGDYHGGFLNFGLWTDGNKDYLSAAENLVRTLGKNIGLSVSSHLLDVASGLCAQDVLLNKEFGCEVDALDVTWKHVVLGRKRIVRAGVGSKVRVHHGTATKLPFSSECFSHVMGIEGPAHFDTREDFFHEAFRVLKNRGVMGLSDYVLVRKPRNLVEYFFLEAACWLWHAPRANQDTISSYRTKLERSGFRNVVIEPVGKYVIPGYYNENRRKETIKALEKIRGFWVTHMGRIIDFVMYHVFRLGVVEYVLVRAEKL